jgi:hypothetical protein
MLNNLKKLIAHNVGVFEYNRSAKAGGKAFRAYVSGQSPEAARPPVGMSNYEGFKAGWTITESLFVLEWCRRVAAKAEAAADGLTDVVDIKRAVLVRLLKEVRGSERLAALKDFGIATRAAARTFNEEHPDRAIVHEALGNEEKQARGYVDWRKVALTLIEKVPNEPDPPGKPPKRPRGPNQTERGCG